MYDNHYAITQDKARDRHDRLDDIYQARKEKKQQEFLDKLNNGDLQEALDMMWYADNKGIDFIQRAIEEIISAAHLQNAGCNHLLEEMAEKWAEFEMDKEELELE